MRNTVAHYLRCIYLLQSLPSRVASRAISWATRASCQIDIQGLRIYHPESITIGKNFSAGKHLWVESVNGSGVIRIGKNVNLSDRVHIGSMTSISIGDGTLIGSDVLITDHSHGDTFRPDHSELSTPPTRRPLRSQGPVVIGSNVWICDGVRILPGLSIGNGSIIGANSVVNTDVPSHEIWAGVPARRVRSLLSE
jgi:lipopolysaccharide O-acetyltransferase